MDDLDGVRDWVVVTDCDLVPLRVEDCDGESEGDCDCEGLSDELALMVPDWDGV